MTFKMTLNDLEGQRSFSQDVNCTKFEVSTFISFEVSNNLSRKYHDIIIENILWQSEWVMNRVSYIEALLLIRWINHFILEKGNSKNNSINKRVILLINKSLPISLSLFVFVRMSSFEEIFDLLALKDQNYEKEGKV